MSELCGGSNAVNLYQNGRFVPPTTTSSRTTTSAATTTHTPVPTLSTDQLYVVFSRLESDIQHLNDLVKAWQDAIKNSKRSLNYHRRQTQTQVITLQAVQEDTRPLSKFFLMP